MSNYRPDRQGLRALAKSSEMGAAMVRAAEAGRTWAESVAPRDSGAYAGSFRVEPATVQGGWNNEDRAGAALVNDARHAGVVESRSHVLARSVDIIEGQG